MTTGRPRVVIDTNILISAAGNLAAFAAGNVQISVASKVLIAALKGEVEVFVCPGIRDEYREKMASDSYMPRLKGRMPPLWMIDFLLTASIDALDPALGEAQRTRDPDDAIFLAAATQYDAILITSNLFDYPEDGRGGVEVLHAGQFLGKFPKLKEATDCCPNGCCPGVRRCRTHGGGE